MSMLTRFRSLFNSPSVRDDDDYSKEINREAIVGVLLVYHDFVHDEEGGYFGTTRQEWMSEVQGGMTHLHQDMLRFVNDYDHPFSIICKFLQSEHASGEALLDFLEVSLKSPGHASKLFYEPMGNDFVGAINAVLDRHGCPYLLTSYAYRINENDPNDLWPRTPEITAYPRAYLKQSDILQKEAIQPALELLSDPAYESANSLFRKALDRHRSGDFEGVATTCVAALESAIKVCSTERRLSVRGDSLSKLAQSYLSKAGLPATFRKPIDFVAESRHKEGDAHGHETVSAMTHGDAKFLIGLTASLIVYLV